LYLAFASSVQARLTESACEGCISHTHMHTRTTHAHAEHLHAPTHTHTHTQSICTQVMVCHGKTDAW